MKNKNVSEMEYHSPFWYIWIKDERSGCKNRFHLFSIDKSGCVEQIGNEIPIATVGDIIKRRVYEIENNKQSALKNLYQVSKDILEQENLRDFDCEEFSKRKLLKLIKKRNIILGELMSYE